MKEKENRTVPFSIFLALPLYGSVLDDDHLRQEMRLISDSDRKIIGDILKSLTELVNS